MEPFRIHVADEMLDDLRARLRHTRWPDEVPGIGWKQGTDLNWLQHLVSYWHDQFDWRAWERKLNALSHFNWEGIHFVHQRAASGRGVPLILTHGWPSSFLDYVDMLPMLEDFDLVVPSLPGYGFSPRPPEVGINCSNESKSPFARANELLCHNRLLGIEKELYRRNIFLPGLSTVNRSSDWRSAAVPKIAASTVMSVALLINGVTLCTLEAIASPSEPSPLRRLTHWGLHFLTKDR